MGAPAVPSWQWALIADAIDRADLGEPATLEIGDEGRERLRQAVLRAARQRGIRVRTAVAGGVVVILPPV